MFGFFVQVAHAGIIDDATPLAEVAVNMVNFLLTIAGVAGIISILVSGIIYLLAQGDSNIVQKAKKAMIGSIVAMAVIMGTMIIINTISSILN